MFPELTLPPGLWRKQADATGAMPEAASAATLKVIYNSYLRRRRHQRGQARPLGFEPSYAPPTLSSPPSTSKLHPPTPLGLADSVLAEFPASSRRPGSFAGHRPLPSQTAAVNTERDTESSQDRRSRQPVSTGVRCAATNRRMPPASPLARHTVVLRSDESDCSESDCSAHGKCSTKSRQPS